MGKEEVAAVIQAAVERGEALKELEAELQTGQEKLNALEMEERKLRDSRTLIEKARLERARAQETKMLELEDLQVFILYLIIVRAGTPLSAKLEINCATTHLI